MYWTFSVDKSVCGSGIVNFEITVYYGSKYYARKSSMMDGIWLENQNVSFRQNLPMPHADPSEALIQLRLAGICSTDLELVKGYYPYTGILGHEFVGDVIQATEHEDWIGKRVVGEINISCGRCNECLAGRPTHCVGRTVLGISNKNGAFANYLTLPVENLHLVPDNISDEQAVFTEPLAAALEIHEQVQICPTDRVLLVGAGRLGQLIAQTMSLTGCELLVLTRREKQQKLLESTGARFIERGTLPEHTMDVVIEATGSPDGFEIARQAVRPRGTIILKSTYHGNLELDMSRIVVDEIQLIGSRCGPFPAALKLLSTNRVDTQPLIDACFPLKKCLEAFQLAAQPGIFKVLLKP
jgi:threonine dehydrogenase-like Zn-dependent dehydrogenase